MLITLDLSAEKVVIIISLDDSHLVYMYIYILHVCLNKR